MANDRLELCESTSACIRGSRQKSGHIKDKRWLNSTIHLAVNERGMSTKFIFIEETHAGCKEAIDLIKNLDASLVFADRAYDNNKILPYVAMQNIRPIIHPKRNRIEQRDYNHKLYRFRYIIKNTFLAFKCWHFIIIRYVKTLDGLVASIYFRCTFMYLSFF